MSLMNHFLLIQYLRFGSPISNDILVILSTALHIIEVRLTGLLLLSELLHPSWNSGITTVSFHFFVIIQIWSTWTNLPIYPNFTPCLMKKVLDICIRTRTLINLSCSFSSCLLTTFTRRRISQNALAGNLTVEPVADLTGVQPGS